MSKTTLTENLLISCICVSIGEIEDLKKLISQFISQTYDRKELIIVFKDYEGEKKRLLNDYGNYNIFAYEINSSTDEMFNYGFNKAHGNYICIWNEKNWYHPAKIQYQYHAIEINQTAVCLINYIIIADLTEEKAYISAKNIWVETLIYEKKELAHIKYSNFKNYIEEIFDEPNKIYLINDVPNLQIKNINKNNSIEERNKIKENGYQIGEADFQAIKNIIEQRISSENGALWLDDILENPIFEPIDENLKKDDKIPKIIHITYKEKKIPKKFENTYQSIIYHHPDWNIILYDDDDIKNIIKEEFPTLLKIYESYPIHIQRIDLFRVLIVYLRGGFYLDLVI